MNTKQIEALKLALEALEDARTFTGAWPAGAKAIAAIKEALAEQPAQQQEPVMCPFPCGWKRLFEIIIADGAFLARSLEEDEAITAHQREVVMRLIDYAKTMALHGMNTYPPASKPLTDERHVSTADELPNGFVPLQKENGRIVYAACMDSSARHYKWLMWLHPDGQWVSKRRLEDWEVMQVEDQAHYGIVQEAAHGIGEKPDAA